MQSEEIITQYYFIIPLGEVVYFLFSVPLITEKRGIQIRLSSQILILKPSLQIRRFYNLYHDHFQS